MDPAAPNLFHGTKDKPLDAGLYHGSCTHGTGLNGHIDLTASNLQVPSFLHASWMASISAQLWHLFWIPLNYVPWR